MKTVFYKRRIKEVLILLAILFGASSSALSSIYTNDMDYVIGDAKQAFIQNAITTTEQADNLIEGFKNMGVNGIRIPIYAEGLNPNKTMFDYFYNQAVAAGFPIFANPAQSSGGNRIAIGILNGEVTSVKDDPIATNVLINRIKDFANEYPCTWINPFNEDGRSDMAWSISQINLIYSSLSGNLNGAELIGLCPWGLVAGVDLLEKTNVLDYVTVAATHNLGFNHDLWDDFIALAGDLPVWDSEVNHNDKYGTGTRLEKALENKVDGLVLYDIWKSISLTDGSIDKSGDEIMTMCLKNYTKGVNLALNGTATQSSTGSNSVASRSIDGDTNGNWGGGSVSISLTSEVSTNPWWQVDLGSEQKIGKVVMYNRTDGCCKANNSDFTISVLDAQGNVVHSEVFTVMPDFAVTTDAGDVYGQTIKIQQNNANPLALAEVEVYEGGTSTAISPSPEESRSNVNIYPNPASDFFTVTKSNGALIEVFNTSGNLLISRVAQSDEYRLDIYDLVSGIYLVRVNNNGVISNQKLIKR